MATEKKKKKIDEKIFANSTQKLGKHAIPEDNFEKSDFDWCEILRVFGIIVLIAAFVMSAISLFLVNQKGLQGEKIVELEKKINELEKKQTTIGDQIKQNEKIELTKESLDDKKEVQNLDEFKAENIPVGFTPDESLVNISNEVEFPEIPEDITPYRKFCDIEGIWGEPRAGYNFGYNDAAVDVNRRANVQIPTWKWLAFTGEELWLPGIGSLKDPNGGETLVVLINVWEEPGEFLNAYILHGFWGLGEVWDMSDMTFDEDGNPVYGQYTLGTLATIRNHYINQLGSTEPNPEFRGHTGKATQAETITWACVIRWYDGSFKLVDSGQWVR